MVPLDRTYSSATQSPRLREHPRRKILHAHLRYCYLTAFHVRRLFYAEGSLSTARAWLAAFHASGVLGRHMHRPTYPAPATYVYYLTRKGVGELGDLGVELPARFFPARGIPPSPYHLTHTLELNDLLIALELLERERGDLVRETVLHEYALKRRGTRVVVTAAHERTLVTATVIPDAWVRLRFPRDRQSQCLSIELDRGTEGQRRWKAKARALLAWVHGPYQQAFDTNSLTIAVFTTAGKLRCENLQRWTEQTIDELAAEQARTPRDRAAAADLFRFGWGSPATTPPAELFLMPRWQRPFDARRVPLLEGLS